ncbi:uncharacterized protein M437DRAFT_68347 [Aureobasidium melanogenum CBS 110374]|uniref:Uncharacterized protein n=1 Tax=Aureobasidium melanogenum (strain CBS 110374) TaxID=1043003 RepID=A0A074VRV5_AURM1|nr:uncharacterized protein M437DRAFT_68347 [Aureobasidium melanogenum CBS 110374]KEQ60447.1 hypothetical protein M437DRAFT_68347 [Aureobasidium melanogenum CBS 110374]
MLITSLLLKKHNYVYFVIIDTTIANLNSYNTSTNKELLTKYNSSSKIGTYYNKAKAITRVNDNFYNYLLPPSFVKDKDKEGFIKTPYMLFTYALPMLSTNKKIAKRPRSAYKTTYASTRLRS